MRFDVGKAFSDDIAIDLGTANTLVHVHGRGIVIDEPSVVAIKNGGITREVMAVGAVAKQMLGKTPENIETIRPMRDGVIADFVATEEMLRQFIKRTKSIIGFRRPRILISVPAGATPVERRAVYETAVSAGARDVYIMEEPVAAAIGAGLNIDEPAATMVVDIGGGTTDVAVLSLGGVIEARSLRCAGNAMDEAIIRYVRREHRLSAGEHVPWRGDRNTEAQRSDDGASDDCAAHHAFLIFGGFRFLPHARALRLHSSHLSVPKDA